MAAGPRGRTRPYQAPPTRLVAEENSYRSRGRWTRARLPRREAGRQLRGEVSATHGLDRLERTRVSIELRGERCVLAAPSSRDGRPTDTSRHDGRGVPDTRTSPHEEVAALVSSPWYLIDRAPRRRTGQWWCRRGELVLASVRRRRPRGRGGDPSCGAIARKVVRAPDLTAPDGSASCVGQLRPAGPRRADSRGRDERSRARQAP